MQYNTIQFRTIDVLNTLYVRIYIYMILDNIHTLCTDSCELISSSSR